MGARDELAALSGTDFPTRHIGPDAAQTATMLGAIKCASLDEMTTRMLPADLLTGPPDLPPAIDEAAMLAELADLAGRNQLVKSLIGQGWYGTHMPPIIRRAVLENPAWYTAYTPYQPEVAQGRLEALLNFQTMVCELSGMEIANASLLDEATAAAEAASMALALRPGAARRIAIATDVHPQVHAVIGTRAKPLAIEIIDIAPGDLAAIAAAGAAALILSYPGSLGGVRDLSPEIAAAQQAGGLAVVCADLLALTLLTPPGEMGADIVVGSAQRFGVPMGFGGPHAGYIATRDSFRRALPGRLVGVSVDAAGNRALRLALQTREQHIRREKATSNICTAQVLLANIAGFYAVWHGAEGLVRIARRVNLSARLLGQSIRAAGLALRHADFFDTIAIATGPRTDEIAQALRAAGYNPRLVDAQTLAIALDETITSADLDTLSALFSAPAADAPPSIPAFLERQSAFLQQEVFTAYRSEHEMLRYLHRLASRDLSLADRMIPLGSCTMKLNASAEMLPITWPGFADIHPFAPPEQTLGYRTLIDRLGAYLAAITGFAGVSLQPNAGAQGEYAGLLAIRAWQEARGQAQRDVCLVPASAHGTNPASATMAGLRVVVVGCDREGSVDLADLRAKLAAHAGKVACLMITWPSTHGVFEPAIAEICALVHEAGGQVYLDGANLNAQVGLTSPARVGADVCHLNLHKTFCIPHGGGGPGVGPIAVAAHLLPHLPNHPARDDAGPADGVGPVAGAPFGSAGILPISYAYIRLMGADGLRRASQSAILAANYIAARLRPHFPVLYTGPGGLVAHECIIDCRQFQASAGIGVEDIAKRLQDFGYHAPTMSWPVPGTLMIEPTESETLGELDRFCGALISIRAEIAAIESGRMDRADNPLKHAPHTAAALAAANWPHAYSRESAVFPADWVRAAKYWPPVARVDNVWGDRNLVCTCPPIEAYDQAAE